MQHYALVVDVRARTTVVTVYEHDQHGWLRQVWRDDRAYTAPPAVVTQVLCGALVAIAGRTTTDEVVQDLCELTSDLW